MAGALLRSGSLSDFHPLGAVGKPVYSAASQLRATVRRMYGKDVADLFAIPKRHDQGDIIDWYAPEPGPVIPWSAATPEERSDARGALASAHARLATESAALQADDETSERKVFGRLLAQATRIPGEDHIYLVAGRPVMTFWGFHPLGAPTSFDVIGGLGANTAAAASRAAHEESRSTAAGASAPTVATEDRRRRSWWWLVPLLLLLLLLLLFGLKSCGVPVPYTDWLPTLPLGTVSPPAVTAPAAVPAGLKPVLDAQGRPVVRSDGAFVYVDADGHAVAVYPDGRQVPLGADGMTLPPEPVVSPGQTNPPAGKPSDSTKPSDAAKPSNAARPNPAGNPPGAPTGSGADNSGTPLNIPDKAIREGDTGFLNGAWRSITGLQDKAGNPVDLSYEFNNGQGPVTLRRSVGDQQQTCTGKVGSAMEAGQLRIDQGEVRCPDGTVFQKARVVCAPGSGGQAKCQGINENGSTYDVDIVK